jgi:hypothetical protein
MPGVKLQLDDSEVNHPLGKAIPPVNGCVNGHRRRLPGVR